MRTKCPRCGAEDAEAVELEPSLQRAIGCERLVGCDCVGDGIAAIPTDAVETPPVRAEFKAHAELLEEGMRRNPLLQALNKKGRPKS